MPADASNMVMKAWRPSRWLPLIMLAWGVVITLTGIVQNFTGLFIARVFVSDSIYSDLPIPIPEAMSNTADPSLESPKQVSSPVYPFT